MSWFRRTIRVRPQAATIRQDVDAELEFHLRSRVDELMRSGLPEEAAREQAVREFGDVAAARAELEQLDRGLVRRQARSVWWWDLVADLRFATRTLARQPAFTLAALATLALGIGATTAIFTVINAALLRPFPYHRPDRLVHLWETYGPGGVATSEASYPDFLDWRAQSTAFSGLEGYDETNVTVTHPDGASMLRGARVTAGFFDLLGVTPALGRGFVPGEDRADGTPVVILSDRYWRRALGADPAAVGRGLTINHRPFDIIGVLPPGFHFAPAGDAELWLTVDRTAATREQRFNHWLRVVARLRDGVSPEAAAQNLAVVMARLAAAYPETNGGRGGLVVPVRDQAAGKVRPVLLALFAAVAVLLLIACSNVAGLLLARSLARGRELGIRAAMGASRSRLVRQMLTESLVLAAGGTVIGFLIARAGVSSLMGRVPDGLFDQMSYLRDTNPDGVVLLFTAGLALFAALAFGLAPAWMASRTEVTSLLAGGGRATAGGTRGRLRDFLVGGELALTAVLLVAATLVGKSLLRLIRESPGFVAEGVLTARVPLAGPSYQTPAAMQRFFGQLLDQVGALPGVLHVGAVSNLPLNGGGTLTYRVEGLPEPDPGARPEVIQRGVAGAYFRVLGIPVVAGRTFDARDDSTGAFAILINQSLARQIAPEGNAVGRVFRFYILPDTPFEVVGVVGDVKTAALDAAPPPTIYYSHLQSAENRLTLVIRTATDPKSLVPAVQAAVRALDPSLPVYQVSTMEDVIARSPPALARRYSLVLIGAFGSTALLLAVVGIYGVVAFSVAQRARELGIRAALGATTGQLLALVMRHGTRLVVGGVGVGFVLALGFGRFLGSLLYRVDPADPLAFLAVGVVLATITLVASAIPAQRAARANPASVLRIE